MQEETVDVTAMLSAANGASCYTETFATSATLAEMIAWARALELEGRELIELICDVRAKEPLP